MKYFIYCRVSSDREDKQVLGTISQKKELMEIAEKQGLGIVDVYVEEQSAFKPGRLKFNEMLTRIEKGEADGIIVWHLTRVARNSLDGGRVIYMMDEGHIKEIRTKEKVYTGSAEDKFIMQIEFAMSKKSSDDTSNFVKRDNKTKVNKGEYPGKVPPGYLNISKEGVIVGKSFDNKKQQLLESQGRPLKRIEIDPIEGIMHKKIFELATTGAYNLAMLRDEAFKIGLKSKSGNKLSKSKIDKMLKNPFYYGEFRHNGELYKGTHEPLISKEMFECIQEVLSGRTRPKNEKREYVLTTMIKCADCGGLMSGDYQKGTHYYRCARAKGKDATCPNKRHHREDKLEESAVSILQDLEVPESVIDWSLKVLHRLHEEESKTNHSVRTKSHQDLINARTKQKNIRDKYFSPLNKNGDIISDEDYIEMKNEIAKEIEYIESIQKDKDTSEDNWYEKCEEFFKITRKFVRTYEQCTIEDKRTVLNAIGSNFILKDGKLSMELNKPFSSYSRPNLNKAPIRTVSNPITKSQSDTLTLENSHWLRKTHLARTILLNNDRLKPSLVKKLKYTTWEYEVRRIKDKQEYVVNQ